mmetsp:Transcript_26067/g.77891  ORF Transcript_26067/g.77891 Transcript_26067/m.77891 type:complete len:221 (+) Transcript_26067:1673-2335(+)
MILSTCSTVGGSKFGTGTKKFRTCVPSNQAAFRGSSSVRVTTNATPRPPIAAICSRRLGVEETATSSHRKEKFLGSSTFPPSGPATSCLVLGSLSRALSGSANARRGRGGSGLPSCAFFQLRLHAPPVWMWFARTNLAMCSAKAPGGMAAAWRTTKPSGHTPAPTADGSRAQRSRHSCSCREDPKVPRKTTGTVGRPSSSARATTRSQLSHSPACRAANT